MIVTIFFVLTCIYCFQLGVLLFGIRRAPLHPLSEDLPKVSVIVAARNEEKSIETCIQSLLENDYPEDLHEIILVNDSSTDKTGDIMLQYAKKHPNVLYVAIEMESLHLRGKANALAEGIKRSSGTIYLFTDADCRVPPQWIRKQVSYFDSQTGIVGGFTKLRSWNWFTGMQSLDWFFLYSIAAGAIGLNKPLTAVGNNLCIRKKAYDDTGGYEKLPFSVTEDYILVNAVKKTGKWKIRFPLDSDTLVQSSPCPGPLALFRQKHRWAIGSSDMKAVDFLLFLPIFLLHALIVLFPITGFIPALTAFLIKTGVDSVFVFKTLSTFRSRDLYRYIFHFELLYIIYVLLLPFQILFRKKVIWKDRKYE
jgi:cellulose synthase/poly-beta-1,6-N-acetylglucosamine synthase-like glycosyltransferase